MSDALTVLAVLIVLYGVWKLLEHLGRDRWTEEEQEFIDSYRERKAAAREAIGSCCVHVMRTPMKDRDVFGRLYYWLLRL